MCRINPMSEIRAIAEMSRRKCLPPNARLLWRVLFDCANDRQERNPDDNSYDWPEDFFPISNDELKFNSALEKRALLEARNVLRDIGAIDFIPGENNRRPAEYRIRYLTVQRDKNAPPRGTADVPPEVPIYKDKEKEKDAGKDGRPRTKKDGEDSLTDYHKHPRARGVGRQKGDPVKDRGERASEIRKGFKAAFGRYPTSGELETLVVESWNLQFEPIMVSMALIKAAMYEPASPVNYAGEILRDWERNHVRQPHHVEQYDAEYDLMIGKLGYWKWEEKTEMCKAAQRKRYRENVYNGIADLPC